MTSATAIKKKTSVPKKTQDKAFPVVAIGASAGGLEAVSALLRNLSADTGMAYIFVQHLSADHKSYLVPILSRITKMKVQEIEEMEHMAPDNVYVIPHNKEIEVIDGHIQLLPRPKKHPSNLSIDLLFSSLAATHKENTVGIILSGNASDGTLGLKAIKDAGGVTFAQDDSAQARSMPESAIASGMVDFVLSPKEIARELGRIGKNGLPLHNGKASPKKGAVENNTTEMKAFFELLHKKTGVDFSHYKLASFKRRLDHRMLQAGTHSVKEYEKILLEKEGEADGLYKDLLINVTSFFREVEVFRYLKTSFLPRLLKGKPDGETLRIWVAACSTGQEAYSIAMLIAELQDNAPQKITIQIFATDLSKQAITEARVGEYSQNDVEGVSEKRLARFFTKNGNNYRITKEIREVCIFAPHNILRDPPLSRMDLISCCNLLIYFDVAAQKKALSSMHFALKDNGYLMLGKSETVGTSSQLFTQINNKYKVFSRKKNTGTRKIPLLIPGVTRPAVFEKNIRSAFKKNAAVGFAELDSAIDAILIAHYMPACAIINKEMDIIQFRGSTSFYLSHPPGKASLNILKMTKPEFALELRGAIHKAIKTKQAVHKSGIEIKIDSTFRTMSIEVCPLKIEWEEPLLLIVFTLNEEVEKFIENAKTGKSNSTQKDRAIKKLTDELTEMRSEMNFIIEAKEATFEKLQEATEEIVSTNEEFQALNEELETSKEEVEATNEELISTNQELQMRNDLLQESYDYSQAIGATIHEAMIILKSNLHIKSANDAFYEKFLIDKENTEGKSLFEIGNKLWDIPQLRELLYDLLSKNIDFKDLEITFTLPGAGEKIMLLNAHRIMQTTHMEQLILLAIDDITERARASRKEKDRLKKDIKAHQAAKTDLEMAVLQRTKELKEKNLELENANKDLTSFTYISSHDLQEPLRKIKNFVTVLQADEVKNLSEEGKMYLQKTYETAKHMQLLIEDLLEYSRTKNADREFENTDLNIVVREVQKDYEDLIKEKKAKIEVSDLCDVKIIHSQFRQVFDNLISNSLKFSKSDVPPHIMIKCETVKGKAVDARLLPKSDYCHIIYTDNGIGFSAKYRERIFEVFQRLHSKEEYAGTGMGLAICKRVIENHNGIITATGKLNKGARFDIYIPFVQGGTL